MQHMPEVVAAYEKFGDRGLEVIGISIDDAGKGDAVRKVVERFRIPWPTIYDGKGGRGPLAERNRVTGIPASFLLDCSGRVRYTNLGGEALLTRIGELLDEKPAEGR